jgi:hypothetical protein
MLQLEASTRREFHAAVSDADEASSKVGGWIVSHQFYSNTLAMIAFLMPAAGLPQFVAALSAAKITLHRALPETAHLAGDIPVQLSITFLHGGRDVRRPVPAFD